MRIVLLLLAATAVALVPLQYVSSSPPLKGQEAGQTTTPPTSVLVDPTTQSVSARTDVTIDVLVDGVVDPDGLGSFEFTLSFDPNVLSFAGSSPGPFLGSTGRSFTCLPPHFDIDGDTTVDPGFMRLGCTTFASSASGPTGDGVLATVAFSTFCAASSDIGLDRVVLSDSLGEDIPARAYGGGATVTGSPACASPSGPVGDVNCDGLVNAIDAALILQFDAGLAGSLPCPEAADVNRGGSISALDAMLILQYAAGLIPSLPP